MSAVIDKITKVGDLSPIGLGNILAFQPANSPVLSAANVFFDVVRVTPHDDDDDNYSIELRERNRLPGEPVLEIVCHSEVLFEVFVITQEKITS